MTTTAQKIVDTAYEAMLKRNPGIIPEIKQSLKTAYKRGQIIGGVLGGLGGARTGYNLADEDASDGDKLKYTLASGALGAVVGTMGAHGAKKGFHASIDRNVAKALEDAVKSKANPAVTRMLDNRIKMGVDLPKGKLDMYIDDMSKLMGMQAKDYGVTFGPLSKLITAGIGLGAGYSGARAPALATKLQQLIKKKLDEKDTDADA